jgi:hypothetical protein
MPMNNLNIRDAIGKRDGDYLTLANKFGSVTIVRVIDGAKRYYALEGDSRGQRDTLEEAMHIALHELAMLVQGRAD